MTAAVTAKKITFLLILIPAVFVSFPRYCESAEIAPEGTMARKMQRGFLNIALSPIELSNELVNAQKNTGPDIPGWIFGSLNGVVHMACRSVVGAFELITLPLPLPRNYAPVMQPEFAWDYLPVEKAEK